MPLRAGYGRGNKKKNVSQSYEKTGFFWDDLIMIYCLRQLVGNSALGFDRLLVEDSDKSKNQTLFALLVHLICRRFLELCGRLAPTENCSNATA